MDDDQESNHIRVQFALDGTAVAILCLCVLPVALPCTPVVRAIMHNMQGGTGHCPGCRCARVPAGTTAPFSNVNDDDNIEDEDKEDKDNDKEGDRRINATKGLAKWPWNWRTPSRMKC